MFGAPRPELSTCSNRTCRKNARRLPGRSDVVSVKKENTPESTRTLKNPIPPPNHPYAEKHQKTGPQKTWTQGPSPTSPLFHQPHHASRVFHPIKTHPGTPRCGTRFRPRPPHRCTSPAGAAAGWRKTPGRGARTVRRPIRNRET